MQADLWHYAYDDLEYWITWPPEAFDGLCWAGSDAITLAPFPVIFKSFSAWMVWPIGRALFLHAYPVSDLICKECWCKCVSTWVCLCAIWWDLWRCVRVAILWCLIHNPASAKKKKKSVFALMLFLERESQFSLCTDSSVALHVRPSLKHMEKRSPVFFIWLQ